MSGADDIRAAVEGATVLAFPRAVAGGVRDPLKTSQTGGSAEQAAAGGRARRDGGVGDSVDDGGGLGGSGDDSGAGGVLHRRLTTFPLTDLGNAERFTARFAKSLRFCPALGWIEWSGTHWRRKGADEAVKRAEHTTVRAIQDEARAIARDERFDFVVETKKSGEQVWHSDKLRAWGRASENAQKLAAISKRASALLAIDLEDLDADPFKITVANGTLHVGKRGDGEDYVQLRPHVPEDFITRFAPVVYDPAAECPLYDRFLHEIHPPDRGPDGACLTPPRRTMQVFLHDWFGYSLTGDVGEQKMVFLYGKGRNGKGVLVNIIGHVAGDYAASIAIESFLDSGKARAGGQATPDIASLPGVRLLRTSEPQKGATLDEAFVKLFTGGDEMKARHLNKDFFAFTPQAKLTMQGNYRPKITGADEGIWGRIVLVPCLVFIPPERRDTKLFDKLKAESSGVLNRLLDGLRRWLDRGLVLPDAVREATASYRSDSDPLSRFLETCTEQHPTARVQANDMHLTFCAWAKANAETQWTIKGLGAALREKGIPSQKSDVMYWTGIKLTKAPSDFVDHDGVVRHRDQRAAEDAGEWHVDDPP